jgi:hypothetical protein
MLFLAFWLVAPRPARAAEAELPPGEEIARRVNARDDGRWVARTMTIELAEKDGSVRTRVTRSFRRDFGDARRSVLFFEDPPNLKDTALLTFDYPEPHRDDDQWLYLPALRKSRRIATSERGRAFLGTDLSYEDMKKETRLSLDDYRWRTLGEESVDGHRCLVVEATPVDDATARELGYGRVRIRVDAELWVPRFAEYWAPAGEALKTIRLREIEAVQGIWTPLRIEALTLASGHRTTLAFRDIDYLREVPEELFTESALARGAPPSGGAGTR